jgi:plasmid stability protein
MANLTIPNLPESLVERIKSAAAEHGRSVEQELRVLLESRFSAKTLRPARSDKAKTEALRRIRERWKDLPETTAEEVQSWLQKGRR